MGIIDWLPKAFSRGAVPETAKEIRMFNASEKSVDADLPLRNTFIFVAPFGIPRGLNVPEIRQFAKSPWVRMVTDTITKQIMNTEWEIVLKDPKDERDFSEDIDRVKTFLEQPNRNGDTFWEVWNPFLRDILEIDAGVIVKGRNTNGKLVELFTYDGSTFLINMDKHGIIPEENGYYQYSYKNPSGKPKAFNKDEIIYGRMNLSNETKPYGISPLQSVQQEVELMIQATRWNKEFYKNNAIPDGILGLKLEQDALERFRSMWLQQNQGKPHKLSFVNNTDHSFTNLSMNNKDMEWLNGMKWYFHVIFGAYGLSPAEVGFYQDVNRSSQEGQERVTVRNAIKPYLELIASKINREILPELVGHTDIEFKWFPANSDEEIEAHKQAIDKLNAGVWTINEVRAQEGLDPVPWGDAPLHSAGRVEPALLDFEREQQEREEKKHQAFRKELATYTGLK